MIKSKDLTLKNIPALQELITTLRSELFNLKTEIAKKKIKNVRAVKMKRKEIARVLTVLKKKMEEQ